MSKKFKPCFGVFRRVTRFFHGNTRIVAMTDFPLNAKKVPKTFVSGTCGGQGGIRTHGTVTSTPDFESCRVRVSESPFGSILANPANPWGG